MTAVAIETKAVVPLSDCDQVRQEASKYDWNVDIMVAISHAESGCHADRTGDTTLEYEQNGRLYGYSVSAFQVRILPGREACDTHNLAANIRCAYNIYRGQGYDAWTMYSNGKYKEFQ